MLAHVIFAPIFCYLEHRVFLLLCNMEYEFVQFINDCQQLPSEFKNEIISSKYESNDSDDDDCENTVVVRSNVNNANDMKNWIASFAQKTDTHWILRKSWPNGKRFLCKRKYVCHHNHKNKAPKVDGYRNKKGISKSTDCSARIILKTKVTTRSTLSSDEYLKNGLACIISIKAVHNHPIHSGDVLKYLPSRNLKEVFLEYFSSGMSMSRAKKHHEDILKNDSEFTDSMFANSALNPTYRTIRYWYDEWTKLNYGSRDNSDLIDILNNKKNTCSKEGIILSYTTNPFTIFIATRIMQRAHEIPTSKNIVFIDSTSCCDGNNHAITFMLTACAAGAVPIGVLITENQQTESFIAGFTHLKQYIYPNVIITDKCASEINAIEAVWPESKHFLCIFHVLQYVSRWLKDSSHAIPTDRQRDLFQTFQRILYCTNEVDAEGAFETAMAIGQNHQLWISYLEEQWKIKEQWCLAYRVNLVEHHTNNFAEVTVRIFKDNVLERIKAYNAIALIDFVTITMETVYRDKLRDFAFNRNSGARLAFEHIFKRCNYLSAEDIIQKTDEEFSVRSETNDTHWYTVSKNGFCDCENGLRGKFCKHLCGVYKFYGTIFDKMPPISLKDRREIAYIAFGDEVQNTSFFLPLHIDQLREDERNEITKSLIDESIEVEEIGLNSENNIEPLHITELREDERNGIGNSAVDDSFEVEEIELNTANSENDIESVASSNADTEVAEMCLEEICTIFRDNHSKFGSEKTSLDKFCARLKSIRNGNQWESFLNSCNKSIPLRIKKGAKIRVQPTSIQRRPPNQSRGRIRLVPGRKKKVSF